MMHSAFNHELRTPCNAIINSAQTISDHAQGRVKKSAKIQLSAVWQLIYLVDDVLDYNALQNGELKLYF